MAGSWKGKGVYDPDTELPKLDIKCSLPVPRTMGQSQAQIPLPILTLRSLSNPSSIQLVQ